MVILHLIIVSYMATLSLDFRKFAFSQRGREGELEHGIVRSWQLTRKYLRLSYFEHRRTESKSAVELYLNTWTKCTLILHVHSMNLSAFRMSAVTWSIQFKFMICVMAIYEILIWTLTWKNCFIPLKICLLLRHKKTQLVFWYYIITYSYM